MDEFRQMKENVGTNFCNNLNKAIRKMGYSSVNQFASEHAEEIGVSIEMIKKWTNKKNNSIPKLDNAYILSKVLKCSLESLCVIDEKTVSSDENSCELDEILEKFFGNELAYEYKSSRDGYYQEVLNNFKKNELHVYFTPLMTDKNENSQMDKNDTNINKINIPYGIIKFDKANFSHRVKLELKIDSRYQELLPPRKFEGFFVVSRSKESVYFMLYEIANDSSNQCSEIIFFSFREDTLKRGEFKCALAVAVSTYSEFGDHYPTAHRIFLSSKKFHPEVIKNCIWPFLELNSNRIYIEKTKIEGLIGKYQENITSEYEKIGEDKTFVVYKIKDEITKKVVKFGDISENIDRFLFLRDLRNNELGYDANKIGKSADNILEFIFEKSEKIEENVKQLEIDKESISN